MKAGSLAVRISAVVLAGGAAILAWLGLQSARDEGPERPAAVAPREPEAAGPLMPAQGTLETQRRSGTSPPPRASPTPEAMAPDLVPLPSPIPLPESASGGQLPFAPPQQAVGAGTADAGGFADAGVSDVAAAGGAMSDPAQGVPDAGGTVAQVSDAGPAGERASADAGPSDAGVATIPPELRSFPPVSVSCGVNTCSVGRVCCNASCGTCVSPGQSCDQRPCGNPVTIPFSVMCKMATCNVGMVCCNPSCGICAPPGQACSQRRCD